MGCSVSTCVYNILIKTNYCEKNIHSEAPLPPRPFHYWSQRVRFLQNHRAQCSNSSDRNVCTQTSNQLVEVKLLGGIRSLDPGYNLLT